MFCSKCGKTISGSVGRCPTCGSEVGETRFASSSMTSAQPIILPGSESGRIEAQFNQYTNTAYTSMDEREKESGEIDSRTGYRPVYANSLPEDVRSGIRAATEESRERVKRRDEEASREAKKQETQEDILSDEAAAEDVAETVSAASEEDPEARPAKELPQVPLSDSARETLDEISEQLRYEDSEIDVSALTARPIHARGRAGISDSVNEYIRMIEDNQSRRSRRRAVEPVEENVEEIEDIAAEAPAAPKARRPFARSAAKAASSEPENAPEDIQDEAPKAARRKPVIVSAPAADDVSDENEDIDYEDEDYIEEERPKVIGTIIKILIAVIVVAALAFGVVRWIGYIRSNQSSAPIEGVTESVYNSAVEMIEKHSTDSYRNDMLNTYNTNGVLSVSTALENDTSAILNLIPSEPAANDATFLEAVSKIQNNIGSAILMDALSDGSAQSKTDSDARWSIINNSIAQLKGASSAAELTAIINGTTITVHNETPAPTEAPVVYTPLQKGDENNDVQHLQVRLYTLGYLSGNRDGAYGSKTQTAVKLFQKTAGLPETGIADNDTQTLLYSENAPYAPGAATPTPAPAAATATPAPTEAPVEEAVSEEAA